MSDHISRRSSCSSARHALDPHITTLRSKLFKHGNDRSVVADLLPVVAALQIFRERLQLLLPCHRFSLVGQGDDALLLATRTAPQDRPIGSERLSPE